MNLPIVIMVIYDPPINYNNKIISCSSHFLNENDNVTKLLNSPYIINRKLYYNNQEVDPKSLINDYYPFNYAPGFVIK